MATSFTQALRSSMPGCPALSQDHCINSFSKGVNLHLPTHTCTHAQSPLCTEHRLLTTQRNAILSSKCFILPGLKNIAIDNQNCYDFIWLPFYLHMMRWLRKTGCAHAHTHIQSANWCLYCVNGCLCPPSVLLITSMSSHLPVLGCISITCRNLPHFYPYLALLIQIILTHPAHVTGSPGCLCFCLLCSGLHRAVSVTLVGSRSVSIYKHFGDHIIFRIHTKSI